MPPPFVPTHSWVCPIWRWTYGRDSVNGRTRASTTVLYVANSWSAPISIHVDCFLSDGTPEAGVTCSGPVGARQRLKAALNPTRTPVFDASGGFMDGGEGWFQLWANGPVSPAAMTLVIFNLPEWSPMELIVPLEPAEIEPAAVEVAPPHVEVEGAPEGQAKLEAHLPLPEAMAWFESVGSGDRFHREEK